MDMEHERRLTEVEERTKANSHRLKKVEARQEKLDKIVTAVEILAEKESNVESDIKEIKSDVKELTNKPSKKWDNFLEKVGLTIAAAIIGFVLAALGIK